MTKLRHLIILLVTLAVTLSSAQTAVARSEMAGAITPVLCGDFGAPPDQAFDPAGNPLQKHHDCPHCLAAQDLAAPLPPTLTWTAVAGRVSAAVRPVVLPALPVAAIALPEARGPPALI